jgi:hypothetical protein
MRRGRIELYWFSVLLGLAVTPVAVASEDADIRILAGRDDAAWVGQEVPVYLELWTSGLSFSDQSFVLPEVPGALLVQNESGGVNLSERRDGTNWQGVRYTFSLYPQRAGTLSIPPFEVRFATRAAFGEAPVAHRFETDALDVAARRPPGTEPGSLLVTSRDFTVDAAWSQEPDADSDTLQLQTGDALVLTVRREAADLPGMVFAPLPAIEIDGLGVYADPPEVSDRVYRGDLTGSRLDRVTVVAEEPGTYTLPELSFEWWNPRNETLQRRNVSELRVEVTVNPNWGAPPMTDALDDGGRFDWRWLGWLVVPLLLWWPVWPLARRAGCWLARTLAPRRLQPLNPGRSEGSEQ